MIEFANEAFHNVFIIDSITANQLIDWIIAIACTIRQKDVSAEEISR
jgi:hypothetical protein